MEAIGDVCRAPAGNGASWWGRQAGGKQGAHVPVRTGAHVPVRTGTGGDWSYSTRLGVLLVEEEMEDLGMEEACWQ